ncbi:MAG TPA: hypothetical protein VJT81_10360 [Burkholderiales bacterium]|nr:hypothetical protein [Burkholderiales bacterium]
MNEPNPGLTAREVQALMDLRLDKAAEEIGYAAGMLMMALLSNPPTRENQAGYADAVRDLKRLRNVVTGRCGKLATDGFTQGVRFMLDSARRPH